MNAPETPDSAAESVAKRSMFSKLRLLAAVGLTFLLLPFPMARILVGWKISYQSIPAIVALVTGLCVLPFVVFGLAKPWHRWARFKLALFLTVTWLLVSVAITLLRVEDTLPWYVFGPLFGLSTMWTMWFVWVHAFPLHSVVKVLVVLPLIGWAIGFWQIFDIAGMSGDANLQFVLRREAVDLDATSKTATVDDQQLAVSETAFLSYLGGTGGIIHGRSLSADWTADAPQTLWRRDIGKGWSGFVATDEFAFTQELRGEQECVACYALDDGEEVWLHTDDAAFRSVMGGDGPRATPAIVSFQNETVDPPTIETRIITVGATSLVNCLNAATGELIWQVNLLQEHGGENLVHGLCASPLVYAGVVYVCPPGEGGPCLTAYSLADGRFLWKTGSCRLSYSSPTLAILHDVPQILLHAGPGAFGFELTSGKELWSFPWTNEHDNNAAQPIVNDQNQVFVSTGYGRGSALFEVKKSGDEWSTESIWEERNLKTKYCSPIQFGDAIFGLDDGILSCVDAKTGKRLWKRGRYGHGQILLADDLLLIQCEKGDIALVRPNAKRHEELARIPALNGKTWNTLCLADSKLIVRNDFEAVCFQLPVAEPLSGESPIVE